MKTETAVKDLMQALHDPKIKAIWAIRGGRLSHEMWELLDQETHPFPSKPVLGFSDITSLHLWFNAHGLPTIHAPVLAFFKGSPEPRVNQLTELTSSIDLLMGKTPILTYTGFTLMNDAMPAAPIEGPLLGGNLSSLHYFDSVYGTPMVHPIWMIETVDDATRIESILESLRRGRLLKTAQAIIFGQLHGKSFSNSEFKPLQERCETLIRRFAQKIGMPVFLIPFTEEIPPFTFGHGDWNHPFPLGALARLDVGSRPEETTLKISAS